MTHLPSAIAQAVADPKTSDTQSLELTLRNYADDVTPDDMDLIAEEYTRRGGDAEYLGYFPIMY